MVKPMLHRRNVAIPATVTDTRLNLLKQRAALRSASAPREHLAQLREPLHISVRAVFAILKSCRQTPLYSVLVAWSSKPLLPRVQAQGIILERFMSLSLLKDALNFSLIS